MSDYEKRSCRPRHISELLDEWLAHFCPADRPDIDGHCHSPDGGAEKHPQEKKVNSVENHSG